MAVSGKVKFTKSLQFSVSMILIAITLVILLGFVGYQYVKSKDQMNSSLSQLAENTSMRMSRYLAGPMWAVEKQVIDSFLDAEMLDRDILGIIVYDSNGKSVITGKARNKSWNTYNGADVFKKVNLKKEETFSALKDVYMPEVEDKKLGSVKVVVTNKFALQDLNGMLIANIAAILVLTVILVVSIALTIRKLILSPLENLVSSTEKMSMGDLKNSVKIDSKNEIGVLAESIERMRQSMILAFKRLQKKAQ